MPTKRTTSGRRTTRPRSTKKVSKAHRRTNLRPYHPRGEVTFLLIIALLGIVFLLLPLPVLIRIFGSIMLFLVLPATILREYWPKVPLSQLGWQPAQHPQLPNLYSAIIIAISLMPLVIFLTVDNPAQYVAVDPTIPWLPWLLAQALIAILLLSQAAFFTGLLLFRLTHLMRPWAAIVLVGFILAIGQFFVPGVVRYLAIPFTIGLAWMAWQTKSFVPVAATQLLITLVYDLIVRLS